MKKNYEDFLNLIKFINVRIRTFLELVDNLKTMISNHL